MLGPIFNREVLTLPRRRKHYVTRSLYLFIIWVLALTAWQVTFGWGGTISQGDLAYFGSQLFRFLSGLQLTLVLFFSALLAASAVAQEKDRRTFTLLLLTDLRNYEIVLGKLGGSLLQIGALMACALPLLTLTMLLGGVSMQQVLLMTLILAVSGLAAGSLGSLLALWREKTFQTLALTVLSLVLYILLVEALRVLPGDAHAFWSARLSPIWACLSVLYPRTEESLTDAPAYGYAAVMLLFAVALNAVGLWRLRVWNPRGEPIQQPETAAADAVEREKLAVTDRRDIHAAPGKVREVWSNPVLWREIKTRGYGAQAFLVKGLYLIVFATIAFMIYPIASGGPARVDWLAALLGLAGAVVLSLLVVNARAVTAITAERDLNSLELLLVTDLTPREFVFGKLGGIFYNTIETVLPPLLLTIAYAWWGLMGGETLVYVLIALLVLFAFAAVIGLHVGLHTVNTRIAIGYSLGTIFFLFVGTLVCVHLIRSSGRFEYQWTSFIFFGVIGVGGLWLVIGRVKPSAAKFLAAFLCPFGMLYVILNIMIGNPATGKSGDPLVPFLVVTFAFGFPIAALLVPLLSEFDVVLGYSAPAEE